MPTINDLCEKYDVTRSTLYSWINAGNVATIKEGIKTVVPDEESYIAATVDAHSLVNLTKQEHLR